MASRGSPLKPKQGHGVRVHRLSEPSSPLPGPLQHPPQPLRPGSGWDGSGSGLRTWMPAPRASKAARLPAAPHVHGQDKPRTGSQLFRNSEWPSHRLGKGPPLRAKGIPDHLTLPYCVRGQGLEKAQWTARGQGHGQYLGKGPRRARASPGQGGFPWGDQRQHSCPAPRSPAHPS